MIERIVSSLKNLTREASYFAISMAIVTGAAVTSQWSSALTNYFLPSFRFAGPVNTTISIYVAIKSSALLKRLLESGVNYLIGKAEQEVELARVGAENRVLRENFAEALHQGLTPAKSTGKKGLNISETVETLMNQVSEEAKREGGTAAAAAREGVLDKFVAFISPPNLRSDVLGRTPNKLGYYGQLVRSGTARKNSGNEENKHSNLKAGVSLESRFSQAGAGAGIAVEAGTGTGTGLPPVPTTHRKSVRSSSTEMSAIKRHYSTRGKVAEEGGQSVNLGVSSIEH